MPDLEQKKCEPCRGDAPPVTDAERDKLMAEIPGWTVTERDGLPRLEREFTFDDFVAALGFTNAVGKIAEEEGHHPALLTEWGKVTVGWWTHKIGGLHQNDFIMAAKTTALAE